MGLNNVESVSDGWFFFDGVVLCSMPWDSWERLCRSRGWPPAPAQSPPPPQYQSPLCCRPPEQSPRTPPPDISSPWSGQRRWCSGVLPENKHGSIGMGTHCWWMVGWLMRPCWWGCCMMLIFLNEFWWGCGGEDYEGDPRCFCPCWTPQLVPSL